MDHKFSIYQADAAERPLNVTRTLAAHAHKGLSQIISQVEILPRLDKRVFRSHKLDFGPLKMEVLCSPERIVHLLSARRTGAYALVYMLQNNVRLQLGGGIRVNVHEGELVLLGNSPGYFEIGQDHQVVILDFQQGWLNHWIPDPEPLIARRITGTQGWARPLCSMLRTIAMEGLDELPVPPPVLADQLGSLMSLLPGQQREKLSRAERSVFGRLQLLVGECFRDPDFSPAMAARELGISRRYLHAVCAQANTTFSRLLMNHRLKSAQGKLEDPRYNGHRICDIAFMCGFSDPGHFARRFRDTYGIGPKAYRKALADSSDDSSIVAT